MATTTVSSSHPTGTTHNWRAFTLLLRATTVSQLGSYVSTIAYPLLVLKLTRSPLSAGCIAFAATAPGLLAYLPAGVLVDRRNPRQVMLASEFGRGAAVAAVALMLILGRPVVGLLIVLAAVEGILEVVSELAERCYLGALVEPEEIEAALVKSETRTHMVLVAGRPLGGLLFELKPVLPFAVDAVSFVYSVATLAFLQKKSGRPSAAPSRTAARGSLVGDIKNGVQRVLHDRFAALSMLSFSSGTLIFQALIMVFLVDARERHLSALAIGAVLAASGVGGALGSAAAPSLLKKVSRRWLRIQALIWVAGFLFLIFTIGRDSVLTATIMAVLGFTGALGNIVLAKHLMQEVDRTMLARVSSLGGLTALTAASLGPVVGGVLVQALGVRTTVICLFTFALLLPVLSVLTPCTDHFQDEFSEADATGLGLILIGVLRRLRSARPASQATPSLALGNFTQQKNASGGELQHDGGIWFTVLRAGPRRLEPVG